MPFDGGNKPVSKKAILQLRQSRIPNKNSPLTIHAGILFVQFYPNGNRFHRASRLIDVLLEAALLFQLANEAHGLVGGTGTMLRDDIHERAFDVLCHPLGIAADVDMRAFRKPRP
jgi:hypothetical protein